MRIDYAMIRLSEMGKWELFVQKGDKQFIKGLGSGGSLASSEEDVNSIYVVEERGTVSIFDVGANTFESKAILCEGKPIMGMHSVGVRKDGKLQIANFKEGRWMQLDPHTGLCIQEPPPKLIATAIAKFGSFRDSVYFQGASISNRGRIAVTMPTNRVLFEQSGDYESDVVIDDGSDRQKVIGSGVPIAWYGEDWILIADFDRTWMLRIVNSEGKLQWERQGSRGASLRSNYLAVLEKDPGGRKKAVILSLPAFKFVSEIDLGTSGPIFGREFLLL